MRFDRIEWIEKAQRLLAEGKRGEAKEVLSELRGEKVPKRRNCCSRRIR